MDPAILPAMLSLFKSIPVLNPQLFPEKRPSDVESFLCSEPSSHIMPKEEFVPIFCRANRFHGPHVDSDIKKPIPIHASMPNGLQDLPAMLPTVKLIEHEENDLYKEHMAVVSGWRKLLSFHRTSCQIDFILLLVEAFVPPSPSSLGTPSLRSGTSDVDELEQFLLSPPGSKTQMPFIQELMDSKIGQLASLVFSGRCSSTYDPYRYNCYPKK